MIAIWLQSHEKRLLFCISCMADFRYINQIYQLFGIILMKMLKHYL